MRALDSPFRHAAGAGRLIRLGCLGYGAWGTNVVRVADGTAGARLVAVGERDGARREALRARFPGIDVHEEAEGLFARRDLDAVLIATEAASHASLVEQAVRQGKHVFVEKPLALDTETAGSALRAAERAGVVLMVGHLMRYHPAVEVLFAVSNEELGQVRCVSAQRLNFGTVRADENVLFSLGPHDVSIMLELFGASPVQVAAHGAAFVRKGVEDLAFVTMRFPGGGIGQIHLSWLDPHKVRRVTVVGDRKMAVFDDMEPREKVRIYDQSVESPEGYLSYGENLSLRSGDIRVPAFRAKEPLAEEVAHFVDCVREGARPRTDGRDGLRVVEVLAAAERSLRAGGTPVDL